MLRWTERRQRSLILEKEALGVRVDGLCIRIGALVNAGARLFCVANGGGGVGALVRRDLVFEPLSEESRKLWCQKLLEFMDSFGRPKRLLVFVNPFGGSRAGLKIYADEVKPLFDEAGVLLTVQETQHQLHEKEVVKTVNLSKYDDIVCVSGDGILVEVVLH